MLKGWRGGGLTSGAGLLAGGGRQNEQPPLCPSQRNFGERGAKGPLGRKPVPPCTVFLSPTPIKGLFPPGPAYWKGWVFHPGLGRRGGVLHLTSSSMTVSSEAGKG